MAAGSDLLDDVFFNTEVDEKVVSDIVGSLESELTGSGHGNSAVRVQGVGNHISNSSGSANSSVQDNKMGLAQELVKAGAGVPGGVINNTRSQGSTMDAAVGTTSAAGSGTQVEINQGKAGAGNAVLMAIPNHGAGSGQKGTSGMPTLNGSNVVINSHSSGSVPATPGTTASSINSVGSTVPAVTVVNNGPGSVVKGQTIVLPSSASTVIHTSLMNTQNVVTSTVIANQTSCLTTGPTVTLVRPPMQTPGPITTQNGSNNSVLTANVNVAHLALSNTSTPVSSGLQINKSESPKTIIQTTTQTGSPTVLASPGNLTLGQPMQSTLQPGTIGAASAVGKSPVLQNMTRTSVPSTISASPGGIRAIAPQVLAPRLPNAQQNQPNIQNIQLPPGMVLVRSESGQLLMIHQHTLAQMQAQSQGAMATRPATPTSSPPVQITSVQAPGTPIIARQVTPTTIIKQGSPAQTTVQATTTLQRPPVLQNIMLGGTGAAPTVGTPPPVQPGKAVTQKVVAPRALAATTTETLENVKKCKNFLSTLIKLASSGKQSSETAANVKELVKSLLEGKIEAEDFTSRLYRELNSSPQPYLVPFLKRSLPALRQMTPDSGAFIQQSQLQQQQTQQPQQQQSQPAPQPTSTALTAVVLGGSATQRTAIQPAPTHMKTPTATVAATGTPSQHHPVISLTQTGQNKPSLILQQPGAALRPQVTIAQSSMVTLRGQPHHRMFTPVVKHLSAGSLIRPGLAPGTKVVSVSGPHSLASAAQKNKLKEAGGGSFRDDDDINDVASMAGVNLSEESARILATNSELVGAVTRSCKDEAFLFTDSLRRKMLEIGRKYGITELGPDVINFVSHATQQRLQNLLEKVSEVSQQKNIYYKEDERYDQVSDVRTQLKFFEQLDQMEKQRKEEQEREILMKAAKSRSRQEDPEQLRLKQKAKEMQQHELNQMRQRDANLTALAAIGPRKKRKVESPSSGAGAEGSGSGSAASGASGAGGSRQFTRQRIIRVNLRDLLFCLENERETSHSHLLYKAFLK
ncbi:transcription initiation factor TFIID subunit 4 [Clupea harengus]|uniref:Transcription initiation factor TFIID subunit 4 n=1 Tax=Clupea harengus TaxID=7950 RepID=A0A6P8FF49_CLUHA|nr:transcription initiation factor TFIID subunit 4 [Clupea harengus]